MRKFYAKEIASYFARVFSVDAYKAISGNIPVIPVYHIVSDHSPPYIRNLFKTISIKRFLEDIDFFTRHYRFLDPKDLVSGNFRPLVNMKHTALLTFDDGLKEIYEIVAPILIKKGVPAIFFVNNNFIGNKVLFYRYKASLLVWKLSGDISAIRVNECCNVLGIPHSNKEKLSRHILSMGFGDNKLFDKISGILEIDFPRYLAEKKPYMDDSQLKDLVNNGFSIGAHGNNHQIFNELKPDEMVKDIRESVQGIVKNYSQSARFFAFPFTDYGVPSDVLRTIHDPQNKIVDFSFGTAGLKDDVVYNNLQRVPMEKWGRSASVIIRAEYFSRLLRKLAGRNLISRDK